MEDALGAAPSPPPEAKKWVGLAGALAPSAYEGHGGSLGTGQAQSAPDTGGGPPPPRTHTLRGPALGHRSDDFTLGAKWESWMMNPAAGTHGKIRGRSGGWGKA